MKKHTVIVALAAGALLLAACRNTEALEDAAKQLGATAADTAKQITASASDAIGELIEEASPVSPADAEAEAPAPLPEEAPEEAPAETEETEALPPVTDADGAAGQLPRLTTDSDGAASINADIEGSFRHLVDADYCKLYYEWWQNGDLLSVLVVEQMNDGGAFYTPYNLDLSTGRRLRGGELTDALGLSREILGDNELAVMAEEYEYMWGNKSAGDDADWYEERLARTVSTDNAEFDRLWLGYGGDLYFAARMYPPSDAEFIELPLNTGLSF